MLPRSPLNRTHLGFASVYLAALLDLLAGGHVIWLWSDTPADRVLIALLSMSAAGILLLVAVYLTVLTNGREGNGCLIANVPVVLVILGILAAPAEAVIILLFLIGWMWPAVVSVAVFIGGPRTQ
ncbi:hypothetical protein [Halorhodospira sp. 9622]|uniref:hypothetical protein n=1 Tax=Halorhodospira sp. 9622 TaxID=2899136 RepID=UPI001EE87DE8|nr:hypothetical protein [Halorhodospira sp. 9622]MCG5539056.1 hypothetical protein [Halorhodospira sp. 9622]